MGVNFRGKRYVKRVKVGKRTVKEGEAVALWDCYGTHTEVVGPALVRLWWTTIRFLDRHVAESEQYLRIQHVDGTVEHMRGPATLFENPVYHRGVTVENMIKLEDGSQHLVVQRVEAEGAPPGKDEAANRDAKAAATAAATTPARQVIVTGPATFFPQPTDSVNKFHWKDGGAGALLEDGRVLSTRILIVRKLACALRGADGHTATAELSVRVRLVGVREAMPVSDPIAECDTVACTMVAKAAESLRFGDQGVPLSVQVRSAVTTASFTEQLSAALRQRAACNLVVFEVVDVRPSAELSKLIHKEDDLAAARLTEQLADAALEAAAARQEREQALEAKKQAHALKLQTESEKVARERGDLEAKNAIEFLRQLQDMKVDVTRYLCRVGRARQDEPPGIDAAVESAKKVGMGWW